jgi:hypothetical protein
MTTLKVFVGRCQHFASLFGLTASLSSPGLSGKTPILKKNQSGGHCGGHPGGARRPGFASPT